jgi:hypothetical protein
MFQSMKLRGAWLAAAWVVLAPKVALAEARWCTWTNDTVASGDPGTLRCYADMAECMTNADCGVGRICDGTNCVPPCTTIRLAEDGGDCDGTSFVRLSGTAPAVVSVPSSTTFAPTGYCQIAGTGPVCSPTPTWTRWEASYLQEDAGAPALVGLQHTNVWGAADSDGDTCVDGGDPNVCTGPRPTTCGDRQRPATCGASEGPSGVCCIVGATVECGSCPAEDCSTIQACNPDSDLWSCAPLSGTTANGACLRNDDNPVPIDGATGVCIFPAFLRGCLMPGLPDMGAACFTTPTDGPTTNFFDGDCDRDGCPNGHDSAPCLRCDGAQCLAVAIHEPRDRCRRLRMAEDEPIDPMDCRTDAALPDTGSHDAGPVDAAMDAPSPDAQIPPQVTFGGGGGCACTTGARPRGHGLSLLVLGLLAWIARRRGR